MAVARKWPEAYANAVDPGWVPTKMGRPGAHDDLTKGYETQAWLAGSNDQNAKVSGRYSIISSGVSTHHLIQNAIIPAKHPDHESPQWLSKTSRLRPIVG